MKILYFSATGNSLQVAKHLGGHELLSIPRLLREGTKAISDDVIGIITPCYSGGLPLIVQRFLSSVKLSAAYTFGIITYGDMLVSAPLRLERFAAAQGLRLDYINAVWMTDTYLPMYEMADQLAKLPGKKVDEQLARIKADIEQRKKFTPKIGVMSKLFGALMQSGAKKMLGGDVDKRLSVDSGCTGCGRCAKVCPVGNIQVGEKPAFRHHCEGCLACVHHCPSSALHIEKEKSKLRFCNPEVTPEEI